MSLETDLSARPRGVGGWGGDFDELPSNQMGRVNGKERLFIQFDK